jgi:prevent-host-death family protein
MSMTTTVGAYEAKTHLPRLLDQVEAGEDVIITRHGKPVARLTAVAVPDDTSDLLDQLRSIRARVKPGPSAREMIAEGRR